MYHKQESKENALWKWYKLEEKTPKNKKEEEKQTKQHLAHSAMKRRNYMECNLDLSVALKEAAAN